MNNLENSLNKIAEHILHIDEASLASLWEKYRTKVEDFSNTKEWERAVIIFSIINAVRAKNAIFNQKILKNNNPSQQKTSQKTPKEKPYLKLVK
jgi:predicted house-cleaning noncanonical NTP pyrophosphatase (MazG superfamily)